MTTMLQETNWRDHVWQLPEPKVISDHDLADALSAAVVAHTSLGETWRGNEKVHKLVAEYLGAEKHEGSWLGVPALIPDQEGRQEFLEILGRRFDVVDLHLATIDAAAPKARKGEAEAPAYPAPLSGAELVAGKAQGLFKRAEYALGQFILYRHVNLLSGNGGVGKSILSTQVAGGLASPRDVVLGLDVRRHMPALVMLAEDDYGEALARVEATCALLDVRLADLPVKLWCLPGRDVSIARVADDGSWEPGPFMAPLRAELTRIGEPCYLVLDTVSDVAQLNEVLRPPVNTFCKVVLGGLCQDFGTTITLNAHPSKAAMSDGTGYAGTTAWHNSVRSRSSLEAPGGDRRLLKIMKANYGSAAEIDLFYAGLTFRTAGDVEVQKLQSDTRTLVLDALLAMLGRGLRVVKANGQGLKAEDVGKEVRDRAGPKLTAQQVRAELDDLERAGLLAYRRHNNNDKSQVSGYCRPGEVAVANPELNRDTSAGRPLQ